MRFRSQPTAPCSFTKHAISPLSLGPASCPRLPMPIEGPRWVSSLALDPTRDGAEGGTERGRDPTLVNRNIGRLNGTTRTNGPQAQGSDTSPPARIVQPPIAQKDGRLVSRRMSLLGALAVPCAVGCMCVPQAEAQRIQWYDAFFASDMQYNMSGYEQAIAPLKRSLFTEMFQVKPKSEEFRLLEIGVGTGPNLAFYSEVGPERLEVVGLDPNIQMSAYSRLNAEAAGFSVSGDPVPSYTSSTATDPAASGRRLSLVDGGAERMPFENGLFDAVVFTLVLCSVPDVEASVREAHRVLRPGGRLVFIEHVLAPTSNPGLYVTQRILDPLQQLASDGCHVARDPVPIIDATGFKALSAQPSTISVDSVGPGLSSFRQGEVDGTWRFYVNGWSLISSHAAGVMQKA